MLDTIAACNNTERCNKVEAGLAESGADLDGAFRLVHQRYVERGYCDPAPDGLRRPAHDDLPDTRVFVAKKDGEVVGTLTLIPDALRAVPMAEIYGDELATLETAPGRLAEISALAVSPALGREGLAVVMQLVRDVVAYATRVAGLHQLCIAVHPRHAPFYERLRFRRIGDLKAYGKVKDAPAVALALDLCATAAAIAEFLGESGGTLRPRGTGAQPGRRPRAERRAPALAHAAV